MRIFSKSLLALSVATLGFGLFQSAIAGATYTVTIHNNTGSTLQAQAMTSLDHCISDYGSPSNSISPGYSSVFTFNDTNKNDCADSTKTYVLNISDAYGSGGSTMVYFNHAKINTKATAAVGTTWSSIFTQGPPNGITVTQASCDGTTYCLNHWTHNSGDMSLDIYVSSSGVQPND